MVQLSPQQCAALLSCLRLTVFGIALADVFKDPKYEPDDRDLHVAEIFTTAQTLVLAAQALELQAEPYDVLQGHESACTLAGWLHMLSLVMRLRVGGLLCVAPDCSSFGFGPSVWSCRTAQNVLGDTSRPFVREGNLMANAAMFLFCLAVLRGAEAVLENPVSSMIFRFLQPSISTLMEQGLAYYFYVPRCAYDDPADQQSSDLPDPPGQHLKWLKRYKFMCSGTWFRPVVLPCQCAAHRPLMDEVHLPDGSVQRNGRQKEMAQSGLYPPRMGQAIISAWRQRQVHAAGSSQLQPQGPGQAVQQSTRHDDDPDPWEEQSQDQRTARRPTTHQAAKQPKSRKREVCKDADAWQAQPDQHDSLADPWGEEELQLSVEPDPWA